MFEGAIKAARAIMVRAQRDMQFIRELRRRFGRLDPDEVQWMLAIRDRYRTAEKELRRLLDERRRWFLRQLGIPAKRQ
jgi:hypothetical protein